LEETLAAPPMTARYRPIDSGDSHYGPQKRDTLRVTVANLKRF